MEARPGHGSAAAALDAASGFPRHHSVTAEGAPVLHGRRRRRHLLQGGAEALDGQAVLRLRRSRRAGGPFGALPMLRHRVGR